ncbi:MAG TPA: Gfo/Idh/MocA family oxidoreductase [Polyangiaceae bacterium]|nr:Gfo/Idh/MocA family oxidoreductase [Polyangiaceae bacterium]
MTSELGIGVLGLGSAGARHARTIAAGAVPGAFLAAVCDPIAERRSGFDAFGASDAEELLKRPDVGAVVVATPHRTHVELGIAAIRAGRHVLMEKPLGVHKAECERVVAAHRAAHAAGLTFGVVHDYRAHPRFQWLRAQLNRGDLGRVERVVWQATDWYRTHAYYRGSSWRGRYASEGGGLLVNQLPHLFDTLIWLFGAPRKVLGQCRFGRFHEVEVEDDVTALIDFAGGHSAVVVASTGESPGTNRLEVSCDRGRIVLEDGAALVHRSREASSSHRRRESSGRPLADVERLEFPARAATGLALLTNFVAAIAGREPLLAPAEQAIAAVETANAVLWSSLLGRALTLPIDAEAFEGVLAELSASGAATALGSG